MLDTCNARGTDLRACLYVMSIASVFDVHREGPVIVEVDPDDDVFLHCATTSEASYVVSGDHHLLDLKVYAGIPILTIREFFERAFPKQIEGMVQNSRELD